MVFLPAVRDVLAKSGCLASNSNLIHLVSQSKPGKGGGGGTTAPVPNELNFTFNSAANPWTAPELAILQQAVQDIYPVAKAVYGQPAFPLVVNIRKTTDLTYSGEFTILSPERDRPPQ